LASILLAQAISLLFGYSITQFSFSEDFSFTGGVFSAWFLLLIAPILEELAWHSYGTDSLRRRFTLFTTSMIFAVFWALDRKSTRLNSSHVSISYAVFCLKKKT